MSKPRPPYPLSSPPAGGPRLHAVGPSERPRARRRPGPLTHLRRMIWHPIRLLGMTAVGVLGAFLLFQFCNKVAYPYKLGNEEARKVAALRQRLTHQEQENDRLDARLRYLESAEGEETLARRNGYHRHGEMVFLLDRDALSAAQSTKPTP